MCRRGTSEAPHETPWRAGWRRRQRRRRCPWCSRLAGRGRNLSPRPGCWEEGREGFRGGVVGSSGVSGCRERGVNCIGRSGLQDAARGRQAGISGGTAPWAACPAPRRPTALTQRRRRRCKTPAGEGREQGGVGGSVSATRLGLLARGQPRKEGSTRPHVRLGLAARGDQQKSVWRGPRPPCRWICMQVAGSSCSFWVAPAGAAPH